jgi:signal transduction histidine kinase/CheY-like chemotaxis protein
VPTTPGAPQGDGLDFLSGGGAMGQMMRAHDWSRTPIGDPRDWPQSLRTATSMCVNSRFPMLVWWGPQLVKIYNDSYAPILGVKHPRALGSPGRAVWPEIWDVIGPMLAGVMRDGTATWSEDQLLLMDRAGFEEETYFTFSYSPIIDESGGVGGVFCAVTETTASVLGTRRLRVLAEVAETAGSHSEPTEVAAAAIAALADDPGDVPFALLYESSAAGTRLAGAVGIEPPQDPGDLAEPAVTIALETTGTASSWRLVLGIPPRLALDDELRRFHDVLATAVTTALSSALALQHERERAEALAELDRAKTDFFANISHEFRTPLTLLLAPLEDELASRPEAERERLALAHRNAMRLLRLVNALLDFSRAEAGKVAAEPRPIDLAQLTTQVVSTFASAIERAGLRCELDVGALGSAVQADPELWERILLNLLSNALKHTFEGAITIRAREAGDSAAVEVRDTGVGIPEEHRARVFERFHRVPGARSRSHEGSGIGLALVADLVHAQGGEVSVAANGDGPGTTFTVTLPLAGDGGADAAPASSLADAYLQEALRWGDGTAAPLLTGANSRARVLLADDNADMREYVSRLLGEHVDVVAVADGQEALDTLRSDPEIDLVLSDVMMPRLDGMQLLAAIRADERLQRVPVVLLSARAGQEAAVEALEGGADDYVIKPFTAPELIARVRSTLELARSRSEEASRQRVHAERMQELYAREHTVAETLQRSLLPGRLPDEPYLAVAGHYAPAEHTAEVGGDWYDAVVLDDGSVVLTIGDVAGHGLAAAATMGQLRSAARGYALRAEGAAAILQALNKLVYGLDEAPMVTCQVVWIDARRRRLQVASAGHPPALLLGPDDSVPQRLVASGPPLGVTRAATWGTGEHELAEDSLLVLYTDGLIERRGEDLDVGIGRVCDALARLRELPTGQLASAVVSELVPAEGFADDVAVLACDLGAADPALLEFDLDARPRNLVVLRRALRRWLAANGVTAAGSYDAVLAVNESVANAIEHAYGLEGGNIHVRAEREHAALRISVRDDGSWRAPRGDHRGRGLEMMRRLMDEVEVCADEGGTQVTLVWQLAREGAHA